MDKESRQARYAVNWAEVAARHATRIMAMKSVLERCQTVLGNMAMENEGAVFNRWPINHEPLRNDAKNLLPLIEQVLEYPDPNSGP